MPALRSPLLRAALPHALALLLALLPPAAPALAASTPGIAPHDVRPGALALPDLRVASVQVTPSTAAPGQAVSLSFIVYNLGTATASSAAVNAMLSPDPAITPSDRNLGLIAATPTLLPYYGVRMTRTVTLPATAAAGAAYLGVYADLGNAVPESSESNNGGGAALTIAGAATPSPTPTATSSPTPGPSPTATRTPTGNLAALEQQVLANINAVRVQNGLAQLTPNALLTSAARRQSNDMAAHNFLSHTGSDGSTLGQRITAAGYQWSAAGEIIASGYTDAAAVVAGWMNSSGHRAIILTASYKDFGAGVARSANGTLYWTVDFATPW